MLSRVRTFAMAHGVHIWFVAHPTKMQRSADGSVPPPNGYDVSGSAAWFAKADMGMTVHRPDRQHSNRTEVHIWKVRFNWTGGRGRATCSLRLKHQALSIHRLGLNVVFGCRSCTVAGYRVGEKMLVFAPMRHLLPAPIKNPRLFISFSLSSVMLLRPVCGRLPV